MSHAPEDIRKQYSRELAALLAKPEGQRLTRLLQLHGYLGCPTEAKPDPVFETGEPHAISIWRPCFHDGAMIFERPEPGPFGDHYAARRSFAAAKPEGTKRICFFGESAAAGYLYAPHLTPAQILETQMRTVMNAPVEVIDLARTNETLDSLVATIGRARQLRPDALVIFAGNNWNLLETPLVSPYTPSAAARQRYGEALRTGGAFGPIELAARDMLDKAADAMTRIAELARTISAPVVWVTPEINLADWETLQPPPVLPGEGTAQWFAALARGRAALDRHDWEGAADAAKAMLDLDEGTGPTAYRLLSRARRGGGDARRAAAYARAEADSAHYAAMCFLAAPQITSLARELQTRAAEAHGFRHVDLPKVFAAHTGSPLTDRRLFLDYCHLTREGMKVAMAATSAALARVFGHKDDRADAAALAARLPDPEITAEADALAKFGAAVHSAHRLLTLDGKRDILAYWTQAALNASADIAETMRDFVAARLAPCPAVLTAAQARNAVSAFPMTPQHGWRWDFLDADMLLAIRDALARHDAELAAAVDGLLLERATAGAEAGNEHPDRMLWDPLVRFYPDTMPMNDLTGRAIHRAPWPVTELAAFADGAGDLTLRLEARLPTADDSEARRGQLAIAVNGHEIGPLACTDRWTRRSIALPRAALRPGLNRVAIRWPDRPSAGATPLRPAAERLELGIEADLHAVFGEIFSVSITPT